MVVDTRHITLAEFEAYIARPENADRRFEYIRGKIVEVVSNNFSSTVAMRVGGWLMAFVEQHQLGRVTGADGGYIIAEERYIPDAAFVSKARQPAASREAYNPTPPDLAIEVLSPSDSDYFLRVKVANYLAVGTTVWVLDPEIQSVEIYRPGQAVVTLGPDDTLDGGDLLPGFAVELRAVFAE